MEARERNSIKKPLKHAHIQYLNEISSIENYESFKSRFTALQKGVSRLLRKGEGTQNSLKDISKLARIIFGLIEDMGRLKINKYDFKDEISIINKNLIQALQKRKNSNYFGQCASYGEALLNCYLDLFITFTVPKTLRTFGTKPGFLIYPLTGSTLEIDIIFEDFRLAFEFQGEHHYTEPRDMAKDQFKLNELFRYRRVLIPINIFQLESIVLQRLIVNTLMEFLELTQVFLTRDSFNVDLTNPVKKELVKFSMVTQRIYLAELIFKQSLEWLDSESQRYIGRMRTRNPISSSTPAPKYTYPDNEFDIEYVYRNIKHIRQIRKEL